MKAPTGTEVQTLEEHKQYAKGNKIIINRLETCYLLYISMLRAYDENYWK